MPVSAELPRGARRRATVAAHNGSNTDAIVTKAQALPLIRVHYVCSDGSRAISSYDIANNFRAFHCSYNPNSAEVTKK